MASKTITIGELAVKVRSADLASQELDTAIASDFDVEVEFDYTPGHPGRTTGHWDMAEEPISPSVKIGAIKATANVHFSGDVTDVLVRRGSDLLALLSNREVTALEDQLMQMIEAGEND